MERDGKLYIDFVNNNNINIICPHSSVVRGTTLTKPYILTSKYTLDCSCWNCTFSFWLIENYEDLDYYIKFPCVLTLGRELTSEETNIVSKIWLSHGYSEDPSFWNAYWCYTPVVQYFEHFGFSTIALTKSGFYCSVCNLNNSTCVCEDIDISPLVYYNERCLVCSGLTCNCIYNIRDCKEFEPVESYSVSTFVSILKMLLNQSILIRSLYLVVKQSSTVLFTGYEFDANFTDPFYGENYFKIAYSSCYLASKADHSSISLCNSVC